MVNFNTTRSEYYILPNKNVVVTLKKQQKKTDVTVFVNEHKINISFVHCKKYLLGST